MAAINECAVWWVDPRTTAVEYLDILDDAERTRFGKLRFAADRARFLTGAALLRLVVARTAGGRPDAVQVDRSCPTCARPHGRPRLPGLDVHASITHSGDRVGLALTRLAPVGLDVELVDERRYGGLTGIVLGTGEQVHSARDFYRYWTRKESVVKATGDGIGVGLSAVLVSEPDAPPRLLRYPGDGVLHASMYDLAPGDDYAGALTVLSAEPVAVQELVLPTLPAL